LWAHHAKPLYPSHIRDPFGEFRQRFLNVVRIDGLNILEFVRFGSPFFQIVHCLQGVTGLGINPPKLDPVLESPSDDADITVDHWASIAVFHKLLLHENKRHRGKIVGRFPTVMLGIVNFL